MTIHKEISQFIGILRPKAVKMGAGGSYYLLVATSIFLPTKYLEESYYQSNRKTNKCQSLFSSPLSCEGANTPKTTVKIQVTKFALLPKWRSQTSTTMAKTSLSNLGATCSNKETEMNKQHQRAEVANTETRRQSRCLHSPSSC